MIRGKRFAWLGLSLLLLGSPTLAQSDAAGDWKGAISLPNGELGILVQLDPRGLRRTAQVFCFQELLQIRGDRLQRPIPRRGRRRAQA